MLVVAVRSGGKEADELSDGSKTGFGRGAEGKEGVSERGRLVVMV